MKNQEILEGNKLIAEFMGYQWPSTDRYTDIEAKEIKQHEINNLKFHSSWDWLMPVVEKIEKSNYKTFPIIVNISGAGAVININKSNWTGAKYEGKSEISNTLNINYFVNEPDEEVSKKAGVWLAVIEFIKWYNKNK